MCRLAGQVLCRFAPAVVGRVEENAGGCPGGVPGRTEEAVRRKEGLEKVASRALPETKRNETAG